jgi:hypothetical protein
MTPFTPHYFRKHRSLSKYLLVVVVLFSVFAQWHNSAHALHNEPQCRLCLSSFEFEHSLPINVKLFEPLQKIVTPINANYRSFQSLLGTLSGNRDPPLTL